MNKRVAIIDLGTNTFHLLIADLSGGTSAIIHREHAVAKIGMGSINKHFINEEGLDRAIKALKEFLERTRSLNVEKNYVFATSAIRSATNKDEVIQAIRNETGFEVDVISGDQEAELITAGVVSALHPGNEKCLIMDIGGGSVEFIIANEEEIFWKRSYDIGGQRLLEKFQKHDPILKEEINSLNIHFFETLSELLDILKKHQPNTLAGSSGSFDTLSEIHCIRHGIDYPRNEPETPLSFDSFHQLYSEFITKDRNERLKIPGMIAMRVDMIVVACCLIDFIVKHYDFQRIRVSSWSLKEGALRNLMVNAKF